MARILVLAANVGMAVGGYGGAERSIKLAESMPEHDVTVMMLSLTGENRTASITPNLKFLHVQEDRNTASYVLQYAKREFAGNLDVAFYVLSNRLTKFRTELRQQLESTDLVILDHVGAIGLIKGIEVNVPVLYSSHNCETDLANQMYAKVSNNKKFISEMEQSIVQRSNVMTYCSTEDIKKMNDLFNVGIPSFYIPNGTDYKEINRNNYKSKDLIFIGSAHGPNVEAAKSLIATARMLPEYRFNIVGSCGNSISQDNLPPNFIVHGFLSDQIMELLFENAFAFINPMTSGSGTHLKMMRALSHGLPIISSSIGLRGFSEEEIKDTMLVANNDKEMCDAIARISDEKTYEKISKATYKLSANYLWQGIQKEFSGVVNSMLEKKIEQQKAAEKKDVLIYSIIRNNEKTINQYYNQIKSVATQITDHNFYLSIYENDSSDNTRNKIMSMDWSFLSGISITSETINTKHFGSVKAAERVENLSNARNKALVGGGFIDKADYVLMVEGDNKFGVDDVRKLLNFGSLEPNFDIVSAISIRENGTHYDWWATRTSAIYKPGMSEVPKNFKSLGYGKYYSTSNGLCLYRAEPFREGVRYGWINKQTNEFDCEMVVVCQEFHALGYDNIFVNYESKSYH